MAQLEAGLRAMTVPLPAYRSGEHMVEAVLPLLRDGAGAAAGAVAPPIPAF